MAFLSWQIGGVRVTRVVEVVAPIPPAGLLEDVGPDEMAPHLSWLQPHFVDEAGNLLLSIHALIVESLGRRILVDTCVGEHQIPDMEMLSGGGTFLEDMKAAGFPRESIDTVLCTHLHFDHVGWNTMKQNGKWVPTFPTARYLFARVEWEHWQHEQSHFAPNLGDAVQPVIDAGLSEFVEMDHRLTDEVSLQPTPGHTPGHVSVRIESGGEQALITGDMTHHPVQWAEPAWKMSADSDSGQAEGTRRSIAAEVADSQVLVIGTHYSEPCAGHIVSADGGYRFAARKDSA
jgi:glyoxylase-like metal-dependent hydrolase (beta-lactamase superfamily II)